MVVHDNLIIGLRTRTIIIRVIFTAETKQSETTYPEQCV